MFVRLWAGPSCIARAISRRRSSWAPSSSRDTAGGTAAGVGPCRAPASTGWPAARRRGALSASTYARERVAVAAERPALALEDVDLGLHERRALGEQDELGVELGRDRRLRPPVDSAAGGRGVSLSAAAARRVSWRAASVLAWAIEQVDLAELAVEACQLVGHPPGEFGQARGLAARRAPVSVIVAMGRRARAGTVDQSSGIRIQPWRIA